MPVYLIHGFRWPRAAIRIHTILNNIDDAAPEYVMSPSSSGAYIANFRSLYPELLAELPDLRLIEQYDPDDISANAVSQPYAFVADKIEKCNLSLDVGEVMGKGVKADEWGALVELRDNLANGEKVGWYIVYNGDERRMRSPGGRGESSFEEEEVPDDEVG